MRVCFGRLLPLVVWVACSTPDDVPPASLPAMGKADYFGTDDRLEINQARDPRVAGWARAVGTIFLKNHLTPTANGLSTTWRTLQKSTGLCADERFADKPAIGNGSGFLIAPDLFNKEKSHKLTDIGLAVMRPTQSTRTRWENVG